MHYPGCTPDYPEKPEGEPPQPVMRIELTDGEWVEQCGDCGAILASHFHDMKDKGDDMADEKKETSLVPMGVDKALEPAPDYFPAGDRRGLESITKQDMIVPRLALAQALSPQVTEGDPRRIPDLQPGDLFNSVTKERYGREVFVQIIRKDPPRAMEFVPLDQGGGVKDPNVPMNDPRLRWGTSGDKRADKPIATEFRDYFARLLPSGELIALSFKVSGIKVAKTLNGLITLRARPIFAGRYRITTDTKLDPKPHKIYIVENAGWVSQQDGIEGERLWEALKDLGDVTIDREHPDESTDFDPAEYERETTRPPADM